MKSNWSYYTGSILFTVFGLGLSAFIGYIYQPSLAAVMQALFVTAVLAVLEVSLSFDNAIVNAIVLKRMTPEWRHRFITWGMLIAVFGMRLIFPLAIVCVIAEVSPWEALRMAAFEPKRYAEMMLSSHLQVAAFGGSFLLLVALKYFYNAEKEEHWIHWIESPMARLGKIQAIEIALSLLALVLLMHFLPEAEKLPFIKAALFGVIIFVLVDGIGAWLELSGQESQDLQRASAGLFLYLEVLDASFSFDGVVGAFAITQNLFIIMIGLSIGAFFVRSMTIFFVEKETLNQFVYLEQGAFYAILSLAILMLLDPCLHIPEWVTGLLGAVIIALSFYSSVREDSRGARPPKSQLNKS